MKKIVVVIGERSVFLTGEKDFKVINKSPLNNSTRNLLIVKDSKEEIAVFQEWDYWTKITDN